MGVTIKGQPVNKPGNEFDQFVTQVKAAPTKVVTTVQKTSQGAKSAPEQMKTQQLPGSKGEVVLTFGAGQTINLGDYNGVKIYVGISAPCTFETLEEVYDKITTIVGEKLGEAVDAATKA